MFRIIVSSGILLVPTQMMNEMACKSKTYENGCIYTFPYTGIFSHFTEKG